MKSAIKATRLLVSTLIATSALSLVPGTATASERRFVYSYETTTSAKGTIELEQWVTWKAGDDSDKFDFRTELEFALTDHVQLGLYLSDWSLTRASGGDTETDWKNAGLEVIWNLTNPTTDAIGSALYGEVKLGEEIFALEGKLLLQKNFGPFTIAYNAVIEAEWEGDDYSEQVGEWANTLGLSYQLSPNFLVGVEVVHEVEFEGWKSAGQHAVYAGPNASVRFGNFFATAAVLFQTTGIADEPDVQTRLIAGFHF